MPETTEDHRRLTEIGIRYARCLDDGDLDGVLACFTDDAEVTYEGGEIRLRGRQELRRFFAAALEDLVGPRQPSTHLVGGVDVELEADSARTEMTAVAYLTNSPGLVLVRGLRYSDELVRLEGGWRISRRRHRCLWQAQMTGGPPAVDQPPAPGDPGSARSS